MERRKFIQKATFAGVGISLIPSVMSLGNTSVLHQIPFAGSHSHVRHGLLQFGNKSIQSACKWLDNIEKNVFYNNGFDENEGIFTHYTIALSTDRINIGIKEEHTYIEVNGNTIHIDQIHKAELQCDKKLAIISLDQNESLPYDISKNTLILPLKGNLQFEGDLLNSTSCIFANETIKAGKFSCNENSNFLIIT